MKKMIVAALFCTVGMLAHADELAVDMKAWEQRDFAQAHQVYTRLAQADNVQAQLLLGELYVFGEGVPEDRALAEKWIMKAQAAGSPDAAALLATLRQRAARKADIARYVNADAAAGLAQSGCVKPVFPEVSRTQADIKAVSAATDAWRACYSKVAASHTRATAIPDEVANLMSLEELDRARGGQMTEARSVIAAYDGWYARTEHLVTAMREKTVDDSILRQRAREFDIERFQQRPRARARPAVAVR